MSFADLAADTAVRADEAVPGRYTLTLPDHWDYLLPSGGVVMTAALAISPGMKLLICSPCSAVPG